MLAWFKKIGRVSMQAALHSKRVTRSQCVFWRRNHRQLLELRASVMELVQALESQCTSSAMTRVLHCEFEVKYRLRKEDLTRMTGMIRSAFLQ
jgi:hypothetical protein